MTDIRKQVDAELLAQQMRASFGEVGARVIATLQARVEAAHARIDAAYDSVASLDVSHTQAIAALQRKSEAPLANEHGTGGIYDRLSKLSSSMAFLCQQLDFEALRGPRTVAARLNALEKAERERPTAPPEDSADVKYHKALASEYRRDLSWARNELEEMKRVDNARIAECSQIPAMRAELERLRKMTSMCMGVGDGTGGLFVYGDYDSVKVAQAKLLELEELRRAHWQGEDPTAQLRRDTDALAKAAHDALSGYQLAGDRRRALVESLRPFATEYGFVLPPPEGP